MTGFDADWNDLAFASKKPLAKLNATFIAAPRDISTERLKQLVKTYLPQGNIVLGLAKEPFVLGLENQPQFQMLHAGVARPILDRVNAASPRHKIYTLSYHQPDLRYILEKVGWRRAVFINGSWYHSFHLRPEYYVLSQLRTDFELVSPFASDSEARSYEQAHQYPLPPLPAGSLTGEQMMRLAFEAAKQSFDYATFQTGCALGLKDKAGYRALATAFNRVMPYQTYAMHHGAGREQHFTAMNDLNFYDTNHYEIELLLHALRTGLDLYGTTLFVNVMHCPPCARMIAETPISEIVYALDHGDDYAVRLLTLSGKTVRRLVVE